MKCVWTEDDWEQMGWHDASIHAMAIDWDPLVIGDDVEWHGATVLFDIDYILAWIPDDRGVYSFEVAPATLAFEDAWNVVGEIDHAQSGDPPSVLDLHRTPSEHWGWDWHLEGDTFDVRFSARRLRQHFRARPLDAGRRQHLSTAARGGIGFARPDDF